PAPGVPHRGLGTAPPPAAHDHRCLRSAALCSDPLDLADPLAVAGRLRRRGWPVPASVGTGHVRRCLARGDPHPRPDPSLGWGVPALVPRRRRTARARGRSSDPGTDGRGAADLRGAPDDAQPRAVRPGRDDLDDADPPVRGLGAGPGARRLGLCRSPPINHCPSPRAHCLGQDGGVNIRRHGRRFAWLMIGAAIGTTVVLVLGLGIPVGADDRTSPAVLGVGVAGAVLLGGLLGLVPGVRELEVTAARSMLGIETELVVPRRPGLIHRLQDVAWVQVHLLLGLVAAGCLTMLLPASVVLVLDAVRGAGADTVLSIPTGELGRVAAVGLGLLGAVVALIAAAPLGALAAHLAPRLLGPTARDRLEVALAKAEREADRIRIARDLHDGIGHDLTIVSIQASAGRRVLEHDPAATAQALERIESTAREALEELDAVLAQLRDEQTGKPSGRRNAAAFDAAGSAAADSGAGDSGAAGSGAAGSGATGPQGTGPDAPGPERLAS